MNARFFRLAMAVGLMAAGLVGGWTSSAVCAERTATVVTRMPNGSESTYCVAMPERQVNGLEVLRLSGLPIVTKDFGGSLGSAVCRIDGFGNDLSDCPGSQGHWHYWRLVEGSWQESQLGAAANEVRVGDIEGWSWVSDESTPPTTKPTGNCSATKGNSPSSTSLGILSLNRFGIFLVLAAALIGIRFGVRRRGSG